MRKKFSELREKLYREHPELLEGREERIQALIDHSKRHQRTLAEVRKARALTQVEVARAMQLDQPQVSKLEKRTDAYLSTLENYVQALGGELKLLAVFEGETFELTLSDLAGDTEAAPEREPELALAG